MAETQTTVQYNDTSNHECAHGATDNGRGIVATLMNAAAIAAATTSTAAAIQMADLQWDIAKQYLDISKWWREYYNTVYRPVEDQELAEAWALPFTPPIYDTAMGRAQTFARLQFAGVADKSVQCTSPYCTGLRSALLKDVMNAEAAAVAAAANLGYRNERAYVTARDDVRWKRREQVLNRGRDMTANNVQFSSLAAGIFGDLGKQAGAAAGGALKYLGYQMNRNETQFPTMMRGRISRETVYSPEPTAPETPVTTPSESYRISTGTVEPQYYGNLKPSVRGN